MCVVWILKRLVGWKSMRFMMCLKVYDIRTWQFRMFDGTEIATGSPNEQSPIQSISRQIVRLNINIVYKSTIATSTCNSHFWRATFGFQYTHKGKWMPTRWECALTAMLVEHSGNNLALLFPKVILCHVQCLHSRLGSSTLSMEKRVKLFPIIDIDTGQSQYPVCGWPNAKYVNFQIHQFMPICTGV